MQNLYTPTPLTRRAPHSGLDDTPIHIGDVVHLQPVCGPAIRARVIYNAPVNGMVTYTTDVIRAQGARLAGQRIRFRHEHVHRIEPVRQYA